MSRAVVQRHDQFVAARGDEATEMTSTSHELRPKQRVTTKFILTPRCASDKLINFVSRRGKGGQVFHMFPLNATWPLGTRVDIVCA
jgi:hypothetical protein